MLESTTPETLDLREDTKFTCNYTATLASVSTVHDARCCAAEACTPVSDVAETHDTETASTSAPSSSDLPLGMQNDTGCLTPPTPKRMHRNQCWRDHLSWHEDDNDYQQSPCDCHLAANGTTPADTTPADGHTPASLTDSVAFHALENCGTDTTAREENVTAPWVIGNAPGDESESVCDESSSEFGSVKSAEETVSSATIGSPPHAWPRTALYSAKRSASRSYTQRHVDCPPNPAHKQPNHARSRIQSIARVLNSFRARDNDICRRLLEQARSVQPLGRGRFAGEVSTSIRQRVR